MTRQLVAVLGRGVVSAAEAIATADDLGLVRGDGCFDAMRVLDRLGRLEVQNLDAHLNRFAHSAARLDLPFDSGGWRQLIADAVAVWPPAPEAVLKLVLTRGAESIPSVPTGFLTITELNLASILRARQGISVRLLNRGYRSDAFAGAPWLLDGVKLISYAVNSAAKRAAAQHGDDDALFTSTDGYALEGTTSALIMRKDESLITTPTGDTGILDSVTARQIFARATGAGVHTARALIPVADLFEADGLWLASSVRGVCPVTRLDGRELRVDSEWSARIDAWGGC